MSTKALKLTKNRTVHFIGIGGVGMSAIAQVALQEGYRVTGSDLRESIYTIRLKDYGAEIFYSQHPDNLRKADIVVVSSAISSDNPEYAHAVAMDIPIYRRAEMLAALMARFPKSIAVTGTHGKTSTTSMITKVFSYSEASPTYMIGADMIDFGGNADLGTSEYCIAEADESDGSFLHLSPRVGVITNIEPEHMDYYETEARLHDHFRQFISIVTANNGYIVANLDDPTVKKIISKVPAKHLHTYGISANAMVTADTIRRTESGVSFTVKSGSESLGRVQLSVYGDHNVSNALAAITVGLQESISFDHIVAQLGDYSGPKRRLQLIGSVESIRVYDDYAHHPTEISVTLDGMRRSMKGRLICIFQPHRYTRTRDLMSAFAKAFDAADMVIISDIYAAHEEPIEGIHSTVLVDRISTSKKVPVQYVGNKSKIASTLLPDLQANDIVVTMGAGDIHTVAKEILLQLKTTDRSEL